MTPSSFLGSLASEAAANPSNNDVLLAVFLLAGHRLITRDDPFLPLLCLCMHFHRIFYLLHYNFLLRHCGEEH